MWENTNDERLLERGARGDPPSRLRRQPAADPRPVRRRRLDPAGGPAARPGGARQRPQPGRGADQQGADRDPAEVRRPARRCSRARPSARIGDWPGRDRAGRGRAPLRRSGCATRPRSASATSTRRRSLPTATEATRHRLDLGAHRHLPEPGLRDRMPLVRSWWLARRRARRRTSSPKRGRRPGGVQIGHDLTDAPTKDNDGTVGRTGARLHRVRHGGAVGLHPGRGQGRADGRAADGDRRRRQPTPASTCRQPRARDRR